MSARLDALLMAGPRLPLTMEEETSVFAGRTDVSVIRVCHLSIATNGL